MSLPYALLVCIGLAAFGLLAGGLMMAAGRAGRWWLAALALLAAMGMCWPLYYGPIRTPWFSGPLLGLAGVAGTLGARALSQRRHREQGGGS